MKNKRWIAAFIICLTTVMGIDVSSTMAQSPVAIVDVGLIFKNHPQFSLQLAALKHEADQFQNTAVEQQQMLVKEAEVLRSYEPGSPDYKRTESALAQKSATLELEQRDMMRQLMKREAQLHFNTYQQVNEVIAQYCASSGTQLVLRFNSEEVDPKVPASVMQKVNGNVVYHNPRHDITAVILRQIGATASNAAATPRR